MHTHVDVRRSQSMCDAYAKETASDANDTSIEERSQTKIIDIYETSRSVSHTYNFRPHFHYFAAARGAESSLKPPTYHYSRQRQQQQQERAEGRKLFFILLPRFSCVCVCVTVCSI
jgi:hypothetical protein